MAGPVAIAVVGNSGSGKTALLERLVPALAARGFAVGAAKHASHGFEADRSGKDSHRLYASGAEAIALVSRDQLACFVRRSGEGRDASLAETLRLLPGGLDVVLAEGFSWEPVPRIVVVPDGDDPAIQHIAPGRVLRVVRAPSPVDGGPPPFSESLVQNLAVLIAAEVRAPRRQLRMAPVAREEVL